MMMSPEYFYEQYIKDKSVSSLRALIERLEHSIESDKTLLEQPYDLNNPDLELCPGPDTRISCNRLYLERANKELTSRGEHLILSERQKKDEEFNTTLSHIKTFTFKQSRYFEGQETWTYTIHEGLAHLTHDCARYANDKMPDIVPQYPLSIDEFSEAVRNLHLGEWRQEYIKPVCDGEHWELTIEYEGDIPTFRVYGSNGYPYNFYKLEELFMTETSDELDESELTSYKVACAVVEYLTTLEEGTTTTVFEAIKHTQYSYLTNDNSNTNTFQITALDVPDFVHRLAQLKGIWLDTKEFADEIIGLPYLIPFQLRHV